VAPETIVIDRRFRGPPGSGHGGYTCGVLARRISGAAEVSLRSPVPLERPLTLEPGEDDQLVLRDGATIVAEARPASLMLSPPPPVEVGDAEAASAGYVGFTDHPFPLCFGCGPDRAEGDGLRLSPGPVEGRDAVACVWRPGSARADHGGAIRPEFVWAALDCPTAFACDMSGPPSILARLTGRIDRAPRADEPVVITAWRLERDGRKQLSACTISNADGEVIAMSQALWIQLRDPRAFGAVTGSPG
jgi:hypothetical protein